MTSGSFKNCFHQKKFTGSCSKLATNANSSSSTATTGLPSVSNPIIPSLNSYMDECDITSSHLQRPSSCQELSSPILLTPPNSVPASYTSAYHSEGLGSSNPYTNVEKISSSPSGGGGLKVQSRSPVYYRDIYVNKLAPPSCCHYLPYIAGQPQQTRFILLTIITNCTVN